MLFGGILGVWTMAHVRVSEQTSGSASGWQGGFTNVGLLFGGADY